jgi:UDP:flavonoid glycosyltransferase YjiC (YdhE family)
MKIGLDLHGVIDARPQFFAELSQALVQAGHEVHILTGPPVTDELKDELASYGVVYTHLFSIVDYHREKKTPGMFQDAKGNWWLDPYNWDKTKAEYCTEHSIELHFDDSESYKYFFKTPYARFFSCDTHRIQKTRL